MFSFGLKEFVFTLFLKNTSFFRFLSAKVIVFLDITKFFTKKE